MFKKAVIMVAMAFAFVGSGVFFTPVDAQPVADNTCKDLPGFTDNLESDTSGVWGSIEFEQDNGPLILDVNAGYEVTLCIKKGSTQQGNGPIVLDPFVGPLQDEEVNYPGFDPEDGFSHYAFTFRALPDEPEEPEEPETPVTPRDDEGDILGDATVAQADQAQAPQVDTPKGAVGAGAGGATQSSSASLFGVVGSALTMAAGFVFNRRFEL